MKTIRGFPELKLKKDTVETIGRFIRRSARHHNGVVVGLSGGVDSAVVATLAVEELGASRVHGLWMPAHERAFQPPAEIRRTDQDYEDVRALMESLGISLTQYPICETVRALSSLAGGWGSPRMSDYGKAAHGNLTARLRMILLYHQAAVRDALVLGTGNRSEIETGYFTKYGDGGCDLLPIGDLYKTQVRLLAKKLGVPKRIIEKPPTAGLWAGQTDEGELGVSYEILDKILVCWDRNICDHAIIAKKAGCREELVDSIGERCARTAHKRAMPPVCKV